MCREKEINSWNLQGNFLLWIVGSFEKRQKINKNLFEVHQKCLIKNPKQIKN